MQTLKPWLNENYVYRATLGAEGIFTLCFVDGGHQTYQIDDCRPDQLNNAVKHMEKKGIQVIK